MANIEWTEFREVYGMLPGEDLPAAVVRLAKEAPTKKVRREVLTRGERHIAAVQQALSHAAEVLHRTDDCGPNRSGRPGDTVLTRAIAQFVACTLLLDAKADEDTVRQIALELAEVSGVKNPEVQDDTGELHSYFSIAVPMGVSHYDWCIDETAENHTRHEDASALANAEVRPRSRGNLRGRSWREETVRQTRLANPLLEAFSNQQTMVRYTPDVYRKAREAGWSDEEIEAGRVLSKPFLGAGAYQAFALWLSARSLLLALSYYRTHAKGVGYGDFANELRRVFPNFRVDYEKLRKQTYLLTCDNPGELVTRLCQGNPDVYALLCALVQTYTDVCRGERVELADLPFSQSPAVAHRGVTRYAQRIERVVQLASDDVAQRSFSISARQLEAARIAAQNAARKEGG